MKSCSLMKPRAGAKRGDDQKIVAGLGIGDAMQLMRLLERNA